MNEFLIEIVLPKELNYFTIIPVIKSLYEFSLQTETPHLLIDFSKTQFVTPGGVTPLLCYLRKLFYNNDKLHGHIRYDEFSSVSNYINRMGFFELLGLNINFDLIKHNGSGRFKELCCFNKNTNESDLITINEEVVKSFTSVSNNINYKKAIRWCLWEIVDNARIHANADECVLFAQKYTNANFTEFCVADMGIGIRETMAKSNILEALAECIKKEGKGPNSSGRGNGLHFNSELIRVDKSRYTSSLKILSENGLMLIRSGKEPVFKEVDTFWNGTIVTLSLSPALETNLEDVMNAHIYDEDELPNFYS